MFTRFTLADLAATIVQPDDDLCTAIKKVMQAQRLWYQYQRYKFNDDGSISDSFCQEIKNCFATLEAGT